MFSADSERPAIAAVLELFEDDRSATHELLSEALRMLDESVTAIERANDEVDAPSVARTAHRLKGATAAIGGARLAAISSSIERTARDGRPIAPSELLRCREAAAVLDADLRSFLDGGHDLG